MSATVKTRLGLTRFDGQGRYVVRLPHGGQRGWWLLRSRRLGYLDSSGSEWMVAGVVVAVPGFLVLVG
jgi:hypothetical protein